MQPLTSYVTTVENVDRIDHRDGEGGGSIIRTMYIEPYSSYPWVINALKGTIKNNGDGTYSRVKPHYDPLSAIVQNGIAKTQGFFYCTDTKVIPFAKEAVRGSKSSGFTPSKDLSISIDGGGVPNGNNQLANLFAAFNNVDDFDMAATPDTLTVDEIKKGAPDYSEANGSAAFTSKGNCGAFVTATYTPILFMPGIQSDPAKPKYQDPFDYVDPMWTPETKLTQIGRDLQVAAPKGFTFSGLHSGVSDTQTVPEVTWNLTIRRLMVPFIPRNTLHYLSNKLNLLDWTLDQGFGSYVQPEGTALMTVPDPVTRRAPDGTLYFEITVHFKFRMLWDSIYDPVNLPGDLDLHPGWVTWNHYLCAPTTLALQNNKMGYYPVYWVDGAFSVFGKRRPMYLPDSTLQSFAKMNALPGSPPADIRIAPFITGFRAGQ